ncbi:MAG: aminotransferase class I/II-fold pyridoxal phosphate-dependent enzyme [Candidatus Woesearchaeota archaeon]
MKPLILSSLQKLIGHKFVEIVLRGNSAIDSALSLFSEGKLILIPEEGGWVHYQKAPKKLGLKSLEVKCKDAKIDLVDLKEKLEKNSCSAFIYQNPGGYFAEQPLEEIYDLCQKKGCLVILDVSGAIGTRLCEGKYADILIGSFGEWKLVEAKGGGFISCKEKKLFDKLKLNVLEDEQQLEVISQELNRLPQRIKFLLEKRKQILFDLKDFNIVHPLDLGFVVVIKYKNDTEKDKIITYCKENQLPFTECPRYIRLNQKAISIEVKQLPNR